MACLAQVQCQAASFYRTLENCQLFADMSNQIANMMVDTDTISMINIGGTRSPPEPTTTSTSTSSTSSTTTITAAPRAGALLLSDSNAAVQNLVTRLRSAGINITYSAGNIQTYNGTPDAANFGVVILVTGAAVGNDMPVNGQQSILNAQQHNGVGVVLTEWAAYQFSYNYWVIMRPLQLFGRSTDVTATITMSLLIPNHPIWTNVSTSFTSAQAIGYNVGALLNNATTITSCAECSGGPEVAVRTSLSPGTVGRIVQIAHAGHVSSSFDWTNDNNLVMMMINAVKWAANLI